jgi:AcrR family transcriptional regulator
MTQIKKAEIHNAILESAMRQFVKHGYSQTTLTHIAAGAKVTVSNIYNYFGSKLDIIYAIYEPWLIEHLDHLTAKIEKGSTPKEQLRIIILAILRDIPSEENGFANNALQAIATKNANETYSRALLLRSEAMISTLLRKALPKERQWVIDNDLLPHLLFMAFDGFVINYKLNGPSQRVEAIADMICDLLVGERN